MPLTAKEDHTWAATLRLTPGRYEYRIVADGAWLDVPGAQESVENGFGSHNAVLRVAMTDH